MPPYSRFACPYLLTQPPHVRTLSLLSLSLQFSPSPLLSRFSWPVCVHQTSSTKTHPSLRRQPCPPFSSLPSGVSLCDTPITPPRKDTDLLLLHSVRPPRKISHSPLPHSLTKALASPRTHTLYLSTVHLHYTFPFLQASSVRPRHHTLRHHTWSKKSPSWAYVAGWR